MTRTRGRAVNSPAHSQLSLPPVPLRNSEQSEAVFRNSEQDDPVFRKAEQDASELFDRACTLARLENKEVAHLCEVSVSLVEKWRSREARGCPSLVQMLLLPPAFHLALHKVMNRRFGFGRAALVQLLEAAGALAGLVVNE